MTTEMKSCVETHWPSQPTGLRGSLGAVLPVSLGLMTVKNLFG